MQSSIPPSGVIQKAALLAKAFLIAWLVTSLLISCNSYKQNDTGITFLASAGSPPVDSIVWSPADMNRILVSAGDVGEGRAEVFVFDVEKRQKQVLAKTGYGDLIGTWAPNGKEVLLLVGGMTKEYQPDGLWILSLDVKSAKYFLDSGYAAWSPDGKNIATFSNQAAGPRSSGIELRLVNVDTKKEEIIYSNNTAEYSFGLSWSPDGQNLVFSLESHGMTGMYVLNIPTRHVAPIIEGSKSYWPAWSPHGKIIAYVSWPFTGSKSTLHLIAPDGKCDIKIPNLESVWSPTWSPDGNKLGYVGSDGFYYIDVNKVLGRDIYQNLCE